MKALIFFISKHWQTAFRKEPVSNCLLKSRDLIDISQEDDWCRDTVGDRGRYAEKEAGKRDGNRNSSNNGNDTHAESVGHACGDFFFLVCTMHEYNKFFSLY